MNKKLPIPDSQLFYADGALNKQSLPITPLIDFVHYPTLGCPSLLLPGQRLQVLLSLPAAIDPRGAMVWLINRHRGQGKTYDLVRHGDPEELATGPEGQRKLYRLWFDLGAVPAALFDLRMQVGSLEEVQYNSVRTYEDLTGQETVVFCGDSQYHVDNQICFERFIERLNLLDVAWVALIGDICDNGVKGSLNILRLAATAAPGSVTHYYKNEFVRAHELLRSLRHPVFIVPGNHDGMCAYHDYVQGAASDAFLEDDPHNQLAYDGLHHFRRTFGPLYYEFVWDKTRYLCLNTFELTRQQRLGYHAIVSNWGGWMRNEQLQWIRGELSAADAAQQRKVLFMHHDPRGGSLGLSVGMYHRIRPYRFDRPGPILWAYLTYVMRNRLAKWQQEWMAPETGDPAEHPVKELLKALLDHKVWAVVMGHDNENWIDSYFPGDDLFTTKAAKVRYPKRVDIQDDQLVDAVRDTLQIEDYAGTAQLFQSHPPQKVEAALGAALAEMQAAQDSGYVRFATKPAELWGLAIKSAIHFVHVDDIGAYKYKDESDFASYGFVLVTLKDGAPISVRRHTLTGHVGNPAELRID